MASSRSFGMNAVVIPPPPKPPKTIKILQCGDVSGGNKMDCRDGMTHAESEGGGGGSAREGGVAGGGGGGGEGQSPSVLEKVLMQAHKVQQKSGPFHGLLVTGTGMIRDQENEKAMRASDIELAMQSLYVAEGGGGATEGGAAAAKLPPVFLFCNDQNQKDEIDAMIKRRRGEAEDPNATESSWATRERLVTLHGAGTVYIGCDGYEVVELEEEDAKEKEGAEEGMRSNNSGGVSSRPDSGSGLSDRKYKLKVCYCCGRFNGVSYGESSQSLMAAVGAERNGELSHRMVRGLIDAHRSVSVNAVPDILVTTEWPHGVARCATAQPDAMAYEGCLPISELAVYLQPRYHIASAALKFYARDPYANPLQHPTRFIGLGSADGDGGKWLHAIGISPAACIHPRDLTGTRAAMSPYASISARDAPATNGANGASAANNTGMSERPSQSWRWSGNPQPQPPKRARLADTTTAMAANTSQLFVGNISFDAAEADIRELFGAFGKVSEVRMSRARTNAAQGADDNGHRARQHRGFAHVTFEEIESAQKALEGLHAHTFMDRILRIDIAERPNAADGGRGGPTRSAAEAKGSAGDVDCCFCLGHQSSDSSLVVSIGSECYLATDKGGLAKHHVLIIPIEHVESTMSLKPEATKELGAYKKAVSACFNEKLGSSTVFFERFLRLRRHGGNHAHVNAVPIPGGFTCEQIASSITETGKKHNIDFRRIGAASGEKELRAAVGDSEYVAIELPDGSTLLHVLARGERHQMQFCREALACALGAPERADWKQCLLSAEETASNVDELKGLFKGFDVIMS